LKKKTFSPLRAITKLFNFRIFHDTVGSLAEYEKEVEEAARKMEVIIM
jgi:hypothetical protein